MGIKIKPEKRAEFLEIIKHDAEHSVADEPGCVRFEVLEDASVANPFYFFKVYQDQAALEYQSTTPHFKIWADKSPELLAEPAARTIANIVING